MSAETNAVYRLFDRLETLALSQAAVHWMVREDDEFYIPDFTHAEPCNARPKVYNAANDHAGDLRDAGQQLDDVLNLVRVLRGSVRDEVDSRAMQADTVLKIVEKKLGNAQRLIDRHDARHLNLFMAYFDLKDRGGR